MGKTHLKSWQAVQAEVLRRIHAREWVPGDLIPGEQALAEEFGCARATVNRALQSLSEAGLLERRRKAGTRVSLHPVRKATLDIPIIRLEIEALGHDYCYQAVQCGRDKPSERVRERMNAQADEQFLRVKSVQYADDTPFVFEDRWINLTTVPDAGTADFENVSANEWLVTHSPFTHGEIAFSAMNAPAEVADQLGLSPEAAIFVIERVTWNQDRAITMVRQYFHAGYKMQTRL